MGMGILIYPDNDPGLMTSKFDKQTLHKQSWYSLVYILEIFGEYLKWIGTQIWILLLDTFGLVHMDEVEV
jgi:hypothetical protein